MSNEIPTPPGEPFAPEPIDPASFSGCGRPMVIGCLVVLLVLAVLSLALFWKAGDLFGWALTGFEERIERRLPEELADADRARLAAAFDDAREAIADGRIDPEALESLQRNLLRLSRGEESLTADEVEELAAALEGVARGSARREPTTRPDPIPTG